MGAARAKHLRLEGLVLSGRHHRPPPFRDVGRARPARRPARDSTDVALADVEEDVRRHCGRSAIDAVPGGELTTDQVKILVRHLRDIVSVLADAAPSDKAELYRELGIELTYHADGRARVEALPRGTQGRVGGGT